jgi:hypothetical protein
MVSVVSPTDDAPRLDSLDVVVKFVENWSDGHLYVRWTPDVTKDLETRTSRDELTGVELPGLSANGLAAEPWWEDRSMQTWIARRLYDYRHLGERATETAPWVLTGTECGRGPDNEPLLADCTVVARITGAVLEEANRIVDELPAGWGSLRRE